MATVNTDRSTLVDVMLRTDPNGKIMKMVELLQKRTPLLQDAHWMQGNLPTGHKFLNRNALPSITWRKMNQGITPTKSRGTPMTEAAGQMESRSEVDRDLAQLNGNAAAYRESEDISHMQAFRHELETSAFYASTDSSPEKIQGFAPRLDSTSGDTWGGQIIKHDASPSGSDQTSIYLVGWGPDAVTMFYPPGFQAGIEVIDRGLQDVDDGSGTNAKFLAWVTVFKWHVGMAVIDGRQLVRIANIDTSAADATADTLIPKMIDAYYAINDRESGQLVWYMNRTANALLHKQARSSTKQSTLALSEIEGKPVYTLLGAPIRVTDAILNTEAIVS